MQNEQIEKEFFEAFNVPKKEIYIGKKKEQLCNHCDDNCFGCDNKEYKYIYPPITSDIVLKLMQIILEYIDKNNCETLHVSDGQFWFDFYSVSGENINECTLLLCIELKHELQSEIKALFKC